MAWIAKSIPNTGLFFLMPGHSHTAFRYHFVFATKNREAVLTRPIRDDLGAYICGICRRANAQVLAVGGYFDHMHVLVSAHSMIAPGTLVQKIKNNSSHWLASTHIPNFAWQRGYSGFSVSQSKLDTVTRYIKNQEQHHASQSFTDEIAWFHREHLITESSADTTDDADVTADAEDDGV